MEIKLLKQIFEKNNDIKKLLKEGKFEEIFNKYGERIYNSKIFKMKKKERFYETGKNSFFNVFPITFNFKKFFSEIAFYTGVSMLFLNLMYEIYLSDIINENEKEYQIEIENYNKKIENYASLINKMDLTDIEIFMKVMDDMWEDIEGYGQPEKNIIGFLRLDFETSNGVGVCRNMADDVVAKLNAINPDYNARNLIVYLTEDYRILANIEQKISNRNELIQEQQADNNQKDLITNLIGNHVVVVVDLKESGLSLVLDPTNPSIYIYKNMKLYNLNSDDGKGLNLRPIGNQIFLVDTFETTSTKIISIIKSTISSFNYSTDELKELYGIDAQNNALNNVRFINQPDVENNNKLEIENLKNLKESLITIPNEAKMLIKK
ncbi:MAG: hypothetical protein ACK5HP_04170 [Bacilli bacterium]